MSRTLLILTLGAAAGCGGNQPVPVSGTVTYDRAPIADGQIQFVSDNPAVGAAAGPITNGRYEVMARPGAYKVRVEAAKSAGRKNGHEHFEDYIPKRYNETTELTADVPAGGRSDQNFDLTADKK